MKKRYAPMIAIAEAAAMTAASVGLAIIAAAPSTADPLYDLCTQTPAEDPCHVVFNVPVDPSIPPYPARHSNPTPAYNPLIDPSSPLNPSNPANAPQPIVPAAPMPSSSADPFNSIPH